MRLIDADALYEQLKQDEEMARNRVLDTESLLPYPNNLNPSYTRYVAQMDERTRLKHMVVDVPVIDAVPREKYDRMKENAEILAKACEEKEYVVRCKDCIHCADDYVDTGFGAMPTFTCDIFEGYGVGIKPDHYCSYGERGDADED